MKKKKNIWLMVGCFIVLLLIFGYKAFLVFFYNQLYVDGYDKLVDGIEIKDTLTLKRVYPMTANRLTFQNISVENVLPDFVKMESQSNDSVTRYALYQEDKIVATFSMGSAETYLSLLEQSQDAIKFNMSSAPIDTIDIKEFIKENHLTNDLDLFSYLERYRFSKSNILSGLHTLRRNYLIKYMIGVILPKTDDIITIDGDYEGYIFHTKNYKEVSILSGNYRYTFLFTNTEYFTDEKIIQILSTLQID